LTTEPKYIRTETADGWDLSADYGPQGVSRAQVVISQDTRQEATENKQALERVLKRLGYKLADAT